MGNNRVIVKDNNGIALVVQEDHNYLFGMVLGGQSPPYTIDPAKKK
jgi:hypothetical protein